MATFDEFYASLDPDIGVRGKQFEKFIKWFLKTDPTWSSQIDEIWLWNEYPKRWGADCGIDLIFTHKNGNTWAVQSKCISPNNDIKKSEIDSFLSESNDSKIDGRLLIASTDGIGKNASQVIHRQEKQVVCFLLEQFRKSQIEFPSSMEDLNQGKRKEKKTPRPHQTEAIEKVSEGLKIADRGQVLMACGTGKTLTSLWIKEKINAEQVLVLVPSLSLLSQILKEWNAEANEPFKWICVCSDKSVAKDKSEDQWISNTSEIGVPVTSDPLEIKHFLDESGSKVVFATYQSAQLIVEAQEHHDTSDFDLVIADEAHRCAGKVSDAFGSVLDENKIKSSKRLFFTATPRILSNQIKTKSLDMDFEIASMDDHSVFGEVLYELKFSEAIKRDLLSDYQVVVIGVDDEMIKQKIVNRELLKVDNQTILDAEIIASQIAITKAIRDYKLNRIITFHSKIKYAKDFSRSFDEVISLIDRSEMPTGKINCDHISGEMKTSERNQKLYELTNLNLNERRILTNARCLSEGVDVPTLSGIAFINPKQSQIDIIQAVGRAIRKSDDKDKGTIVIPLYISEQESMNEAILLSNFKKVWQIVISLKSQDDSLMDCIDKLRIQKGVQGKIFSSGDALDKFIFDIPEKITNTFTKSIRTLLVENSSEDWFENFGKLKSFYQTNGHSSVAYGDGLGMWVSNTRRSYFKNLLKKQKVDLLESIEFVWDPLEKNWNDSFEELREFFTREGHSDVPQFKSKNIRSTLGLWCTTQRKNFKRNKLSKEKIELMNTLKFTWDTNYQKWSLNYQKLLRYYEKEGNSSPNTSTKLGVWCSIQRKRFKDNILSEDKIFLLKKIQFVWDPNEYEWENNYHLLEKFFEKNGHSNPVQTTKLGSWCATQKKNYKNKLLSKHKIKLLEKVNFNWSNHADHIWNESYRELKRFMEGAVLTSSQKNSLLAWSTKQRNHYKNHNLSSERIHLLNAINFEWDLKVRKNKAWHESYLELKSFLINNKDLESPPVNSTIWQWCNRQRSALVQGKLSKQQISLLEELKFNWNPIASKWDKSYKELVNFYKNEGHSSPNTVTSSLGIWCRRQRQLHRKKKLDSEKVDLLNKIEFCWDINQMTWTTKYQELKKFFEDNGHSDINTKSALGGWVVKQRKAYKDSKLSKNRENLLNMINFKWTIKR